MEKIIRKTNDNKLIGSVRIMLGIIFIMTGLMKLFLDNYGNAWSIQLVEAKIPLYSFTYYFIPILETILGFYLLIGYYARIGTLVTIPIMLTAVYVHLSVTNPGAFPSQPQAPYIPIMVLFFSYLVLKKGGGSWSLDLLKFKK